MYTPRNTPSELVVISRMLRVKSVDIPDELYTKLLILSAIYAVSENTGQDIISSCRKCLEGYSASVGTNLKDASDKDIQSFLKDLDYAKIQIALLIVLYNSIKLGQNTGLSRHLLYDDET